MDASSFGARLKELRAGRGLSQKELAGIAKVSQNAVSQWEAGVREPSWSHVQALAAALGVSCEAFNAQDVAPAAAPEPAPPPEPARPAGKRK